MLTMPYAPHAAKTSARAPSTTIASHRCDCNESRIFCSMVFLRLLAEWTGLEPATPGVTGRYSNQLNYHSVLVSREYYNAPRGKRYPDVYLIAFGRVSSASRPPTWPDCA